ncbi:hypothetical protein ACFWMJ_41245 [Streptomyces hawaiiensis]|uniref:hypothetical protein n=1 Tax=Streptomyces hawaiiensis TaxID=67305 RepID=UPI00366A4284
MVHAANRAARPHLAHLAHRSLPHPVGDALYDDIPAPFRSYADRTVTEVLTDLTDHKQISAVLSGHYGDYKPPART